MAEGESPLTEVVCGCLVLLFYLGLLLMEAGAVRGKNVASIFTRGFVCLALTIVILWMFGYAFIFSAGHPFIGFWGKFGLHSVEPTELGRWFLTAAVAALPSALAAGPVAERCHLTGHLVLALFLAGLLFPLPAHWLMAEGGWLRERGVKDLGGVLAVHAVGGVAGLVGCLLVGRRAERVSNHRALLPGHSLPLVAVGGVLVSVGMVAKLVGFGGDDPGALATNILLAGSSGALLAHMVFMIPVQRGQRYDVRTAGPGERRPLEGRRWSLLTALCGGQAGQVSVSGVGAALPPWAALLAGLVGGAAFCLCKGLLGLCHLDDPVHGIATQLSGAVVGALVAGLTGLAVTGDGTQVAWHLLALLAVAAWTAVGSALIMLPLLICGKLRIVDADERTGIDIKKIKEPGYFDGAEGEERSETVLHAGRGCGAASGQQEPACAMVLLSASREQHAVSFPIPAADAGSVGELSTTGIDISNTNHDEIRSVLKQQRDQVRDTSLKLRTPGGNTTRMDKDGDTASISSGVVRLTVVTANNQENFNYLQGHMPGLEGDAAEERGKPQRLVERVVKVSSKKTVVSRLSESITYYPTESHVGNTEEDWRKSELGDQEAEEKRAKTPHAESEV